MIIALLLILNPPGYGKAIRGPVDQKLKSVIENFNSKIQKVNQPVCSDLETENLWECFNEICKEQRIDDLTKPTQNLEYGREPSKEDLEKFVTQLNAWIEKQLETKKTRLSNVISALTSDDGIKRMSPEESAAYAVVFSLYGAPRNESEDKRFAKIDPSGRMRALDKKLWDLPELKKPRDVYERDWEVSYLDYWKAKGPSTDAKKNLVSWVLHQKKSIKVGITEPIQRYFLSNNRKYIEEATENLNPSEDDFKAMQGLSVNLELANAIKSNPSVMGLLRSNNFFLSAKNRPGYKDLSGMIDPLKEILNQKVVSQTKELQEISNLCIKEYVRGTEQSLNPLKLVEVEGKLKAIKQTFIDGLKGKFSDESFSAIQSFIEKTTIDPPIGPESIKKSFLSYLNNPGTTDQNQGVPTVSHFESDFFWLMESLYSPASAEQIKEACRNFGGRGLVDQYVYSSNKIQISMAKLKSENLEGVVLHELGHALSKFMKDHPISKLSKKEFDEIEACLVRQHSAQGQKYFEEDFSDLVAANFGSNRNYFCKENMVISKASLALRSSQTVPSIQELMENTNDDDQHSSTMFRLLHHQKIKTGVLPASCGSHPQLRGNCWTDHKPPEVREFMIKDKSGKKFQLIISQ